MHLLEQRTFHGTPGPLHREIKRLTRVATLFPSEAFLLGLVAAILVEISEEWETGRRFLDIEAD